MLAALEFAARHPQGVDETRQGHAGRALGVIVPHRDVALLAQGVEHLEAVGLADVLEVDRADRRLEHLYEFDDLVGVVLALFVVAVDAQRDAVDAAQVLHEEGLALHDPQATGRSHVAVAQNSRGVGDHRHQVAAVAEVERGVVVVPDGRRDHGDAGSVVDVEPVEAVDAGLGHGHRLAAVELVDGGRQFLEEDGLSLGPLLGREIVGKVRAQVGEAEVRRLHSCHSREFEWSIMCRIQGTAFAAGAWSTDRAYLSTMPACTGTRYAQSRLSRRPHRRHTGEGRIPTRHRPGVAKVFLWAIPCSVRPNQLTIARLRAHPGDPRAALPGAALVGVRRLPRWPCPPTSSTEPWPACATR